MRIEIIFAPHFSIPCFLHYAIQNQNILKNDVRFLRLKAQNGHSSPPFALTGRVFLHTFAYCHFIFLCVLPLKFGRSILAT